MDIELLKTFMEVRATRHFGRAAENLFVSQAAVSARIKQLEELLGVTLFIRSRNNIQLSREGERLLPHAETVLMAWSRARQELAAEEAGSQQIFLGVRSGIWNSVLQDKLYDLQQRFPNLALRIETYPQDTMLSMLLDRSLDLALLHEPRALPELSAMKIGELSLQLFAASPVASAQEAVSRNYVYLDWGTGFERFHAKRFGEHCVPVLRSNMPGLAADYAVQREGACYLPQSSAPGLAQRGLLPVADAPVFSRELFLCYRGSSRQLALIEEVAATVQPIAL